MGMESELLLFLAKKMLVQIPQGLKVGFTTDYTKDIEEKFDLQDGQFYQKDDKIYRWTHEHNCQGSDFYYFKEMEVR